MGFLRKRGADFPYTWKTRFFVLDTAQLLCYYDCQNYYQACDASAKGCLSLFDCNGLIRGLSNFPAGSFPSHVTDDTAFSISTPNRELLLVAPSAAERAEWFEAFSIVALLCRRCMRNIFFSEAETEIKCNSSLLEGHQGLYHSHCWKELEATKGLGQGKCAEGIDEAMARTLLKDAQQTLALQSSLLAAAAQAEAAQAAESTDAAPVVLRRAPSTISRRLTARLSLMWGKGEDPQKDKQEDIEYVNTVFELIANGLAAAAEPEHQGSRNPVLDLHLIHKDVPYDFTIFRPVECSELRALNHITEDQFREAFAVAPGQDNLLDGGKSGSMVCRTHDARFVVKTMKAEELTTLQNILGDFLTHLTKFPYSLLSRYVGLFRIKRGVTTTTLMVMQNVLLKGVSVTKKYDLKGSTVARQALLGATGGLAAAAAASSGTGKDLDLTQRVRMDAEAQAALHAQIDEDVTFLHEHHLMDYSMLLGVHRCDPACDHNFDEYLNTMESIHARGIAGYGNSLADRCIFLFGIIDLLQEWTLSKKLERYVKVAVAGHAGEGVSAIEPDKYAARFREVMSTLLR